MNSAVASFLGLVTTAIALYGFYWVIRLAVRDGMLEADRRKMRGLGPAGPSGPEDRVIVAQPSVPTDRRATD
jgi:hypothetical protein